MQTVLPSHLKDARVKKPKSLIFTHINVNSLKKDENAPLDYFKDILLQGYVDIVCVSESKLHNCNVHKEVDCSPTFKYYRKDRTSNSGGVIALIRSDIPHYR